MPSALLDHDLNVLTSTGQIIGIDEAGRGALAGPVVAAAIALEEGFYNSVWCRQRAGEINDSKQLSPAKREALFTQITQLRDRNELSYAVGIANVSEIERLNILGATKLAMQRALENIENYLEEGILERHATDAPLFESSIFTPPALNNSEADRLAAQVAKLTADSQNSSNAAAEADLRSVDATQSNLVNPASHAVKTEFFEGRARVLVDGLPLKNFPFRHQAIVHGDGLSLAIAMASIIAKVTRDRIMDGLDMKLPLYGFATHKGYATRQHRAAIKEIGASTEHRPTFLRKLYAGEPPMMEFVYSSEDKIS